MAETDFYGEADQIPGFSHEGASRSQFPDCCKTCYHMAPDHDGVIGCGHPKHKVYITAELGKCPDFERDGFWT